MRVRRPGIELDGALKLAHRVLQVFRIAVGAAKQHMEGATIPSKLNHLLKHRGSAFLILRVLGGQPANPQGIERFDVGMQLDSLGQRVCRGRILPLSHPGLASNVVSAGILRVSGYCLAGLNDRVVETIVLQIGDCEVNMSIRNIFEAERVLYSSIAWGYADSSKRNCAISRSASALKRRFASATAAGSRCLRAAFAVATRLASSVCAGVVCLSDGLSEACPVGNGCDCANVLVPGQASTRRKPKRRRFEDSVCADEDQPIGPTDVSNRREYPTGFDEYSGGA